LRYKKAVFYAFISGILFIIIGYHARIAAWENLRDWLVSEHPEYEDQILAFFGMIIILILLGGITVILGGIAISREHLLSGRLLILLGSGMGLITLAILFLIVAVSWGLLVAFQLLFSLYGLAVIFSILARKNAKKRWR